MFFLGRRDHHPLSLPPSFESYLNRDLGLAVGADPVKHAGLAHLREAGADGGGEEVGQGHELLSLIGGIAGEGGREVGREGG